MFIDPQPGRIGRTETEARAQGRVIGVAKIPTSWVAHALKMAEPHGFIHPGGPGR
jgi:pyruvate/2-oxoglutarate dehydrogenase complex dihydrolipoamide dehydrogenase (E3) component